MRAIIIILAVLGCLGFTVYKFVGLMGSAKASAGRLDNGTAFSSVLPDPPSEKTSRHRPDAPDETEKPIFYTYDRARFDPLIQRTYYDRSKGTLSGIMFFKGRYTLLTTDRRIISHEQIEAVGRDWALLRTGAYLRFPAPPERMPATLEPPDTETLPFSKETTSKPRVEAGAVATDRM